MVLMNIHTHKGYDPSADDTPRKVATSTYVHVSAGNDIIVTLISCSTLFSYKTRKLQTSDFARSLPIDCIACTQNFPDSYFPFPGILNVNQKAPQGGCGHRRELHSFASCRKFKSQLTLTLDRVKVTSTYTVYVGLPAYPTM